MQSLPEKLWKYLFIGSFSGSRAGFIAPGCTGSQACSLFYLQQHFFRRLPCIFLTSRKCIFIGRANCSHAPVFTHLCLSSLWKPEEKTARLPLSLCVTVVTTASPGEARRVVEVTRLKRAGNQASQALILRGTMLST